MKHQCIIVFTQDNHIEKISGLSGNTLLRIVDLSNNRIESVVGIRQLKHLSKLLLKSNRITTLDEGACEELSSCATLMTLDLAENPISSILNGQHPESFIEFTHSALPSLRVLNFDSTLFKLPCNERVALSIPTLIFLNGSRLNGSSSNESCIQKC